METKQQALVIGEAKADEILETIFQVKGGEKKLWELAEEYRQISSVTIDLMNNGFDFKKFVELRGIFNNS